MRTIEYCNEGKKGPVLCEDALFVSGYLAVVIDGVTTKGGRLFDGKKSGRMARDVLIGALEENEKLYQLPAAEFLKFLNDALADSVARYKDTMLKKDYPRAGIIVYNAACSEIWSYGDCQGMIDGRFLDYSKYIDEVNSAVRAMYIEAALINGASLSDISKDDVGRTAILKNLELQFEFENIPGPFGYPVLNGLNFNEEMIRIEKVPDGSEVVLASDGYPVLKATLRESENELRRLLETDPLCFREYRSTKGLEFGNSSFDDRTYWRGFAE